MHKKLKSRPTLATTIAMHPQTRVVLLHLEKRKSISPMEALVSYGIARLSARVFDLRTVGYQVVTEMRQDGAGRRYARYRLI